ncbi:dihydropteroate synthase [Bordetella holmesii]|uniref:Dihydropteroate synthase n=1 Tax=Bordetella holmesii 1058 TaxID=1247648 RepID=A0ABN0RX67_9BORD|nr:dihydropteroate synthase [Bordetella holmesii]AHV94170.1 dihydropteroate synthase [Bordetella holmesii ATCC 51541]AMD46527.1 dihydropteroate synthase [Bordetella holmesii H558]AMD48078.1 dihydropteroate synthase [Bordetella holmesii F627]AOB35423.1 dihydropteroate synthase [Bordetella holmesii]AUL19402.1 dihydropteroate synthase [Bordetella holmesii]
MANSFLCGRFELDLERPLVMGIVNVTPDSFSDGGKHDDADAAIAHARRLIAEGAHILDLGGESTRPGAPAVPADEELRRLLPVIEALRDCGLPLSIDTFKPQVMRAVLDAGADMINDIYGFRQPGAIEAVAQSRCGLCVMHMKGEPGTMQDAPEYTDLMGEIGVFLGARAQRLRAAWVDPRRIVLDPGFGFGKTMDQNYQLLRRLASLRVSSYPLLIGLSRKSMIGAATGRPINERLPGSIAAALACVARGASIVRVHDVAATVDALKVWQAAEQGALLS